LSRGNKNTAVDLIARGHWTLNMDDPVVIE
jgi:hypothetical protein